MASGPKTILLVEDDAIARKPLVAALGSAGYRVLEAEGSSVAFHLFQKEKPDLLIVDVGLAEGDGTELCRRVRASVRPATPVILLTARGLLEEKEAGFSAGADHYLVKPVAPRELLLWVGSLLERLRLDRGDENVLEAGELTVDAAAHLVRFRGAAIGDLSGKEFDLLHVLVKQRPKVVSRAFILSKVWRTVAVDKLVDVHLGNLRRKLPRELADRLQTVPGLGYRYFDEA